MDTRRKNKVATCCCCGQVLPPKVVLPKSRQRIYDFVVARGGAGASIGDIADYVYANDINGGPNGAEVVIRTQIWHINSKVLRPMGFQIKGKSGPQGLYRLVAL